MLMFPRKRNSWLKFRFSAAWLAGLALLGSLCYTEAVNVVVNLRNGDRITGELVTQETNHVVITTSWAGPLALPLATIGGLRTATGADLLPPASTNTTSTPPVEAVAAAKPKPKTPATPAAPPKRWHNNLQFGANFMSGARDQQLIYGRIKSSYEKAYEHDPKKFFRTLVDLSADYGETENVQSANRLTGSLKTDFDLGPKNYCYNVVSGGYDEPRKIDMHYEIGPGLGRHLIKRPAFEFALESGVNYQAQYRSTGETLDSVYLRLAEETVWKPTPRLSFSSKFEFFLNGDDTEQFRFRLDANASYKLIENLSLNLSVLDQFDTNPASNVDPNELQIRTSIGITF